jgi:hypothetical protein
MDSEIQNKFWVVQKQQNPPEHRAMLWRVGFLSLADQRKPAT